MKTIFYWVILSIICGFTLTIASCSDDDDVTSLSAPGDIKYSDISSNSFKVTWTADPNATSYIVKIKDEWRELTDKTQTVSEPSATFTGLESENKYWVAVCSTTANASSASPFSKWIAVKMPEGSVARTFASGEGTEQYPFIIKTAGQLKLMAYLVNKTNEIKNTQAILATDQDEIEIEMDPTIDYTKAYYELGNDIDMSGVNDWTPIGTGLDNENIAMPEKNMFSGSFDGKNHTIHNFTINYSSNNTSAMCGLFGLSKSGCTISNLNVEGDITAVHTGTQETANYLVIGGILAYGYQAVITNCTFKGSIRASFTTDTDGTSIVGGICGTILGTINQCTVNIPASSEFIVNGATPQVGAIAGYGNSGYITYCKAVVDGSILAESKPIDDSREYGSARAHAGGICGASSGSSIGACDVTINGSIHAKSKKSSEEGSISTSAAVGGVSGSYAADMFGNCNILIKGSLKAEADNSVDVGGAIGSQVRAGYGCSALHVTILGEIAGTCSSSGSSSDATYVGGVYGTGSFQMGGISDSDVTLKGKITAEHPQIAMAGGIAGSTSTLTRCWTNIDTNALLSVKGGTAGASCGGITANLLSGGIYGCYTVCRGTMQATSETASGRNSINIGGIAGAASGTMRARKILTGCYSLIEGSLTGNGETVFAGGIVGMSNAYTNMNSTYWWSASDAIKGHSGIIGESDVFKMQDSSQASPEEAAQEMNIALKDSGYGYFFYREKDKCLNITTTLP